MAFSKAFSVIISPGIMFLLGNKEIGKAKSPLDSLQMEEHMNLYYPQLQV